MLKKVMNLIIEEEGQGMTEYGLVLGAIALGVVGVLVIMRDKVKGLFEKVNTQLDSTIPTP